MTGLQISEHLTLPVDFVTKTAAVLAQRRKGKRLDVDTPLPTPTGWTTMGAVRVGDTLFDECGRQCSVTYTSPITPGDSYRVTFSDGSHIVADAEHLWLTHDRLARRAGRPAEVRTTAQIASTLMQGGERNHYIPVAGALSLPTAELPIHPYVLGIWLGDGTRGHGSFTTADPEIVDTIRDRGYDVVEWPSQRRGDTAAYVVRGLRKQLRQLGILREKRIPPLYLRADAGQRRDLLAGLMDSDGSIGACQPQAEFAVCDEGLADDAYELLVSLGHKATRSKRPAVLNGIDHGVSHRFQFTPLAQVFRLARKADRIYMGPDRPHLRSRSIVSVEAVPPVPMRCIAVTSPSHLFLAGRSMIPTHNTYTASVLAEEFVAAQIPFVALDPTGAWWGLLAAADGVNPGLPVVVIGGQHGHLPLDPAGGRFIADLVLDRPGYYVLDLSLLGTRAAERAFAYAFADRLYRRKMRPGMNFPLHLFVDEADMFVPQERERGDNLMLGAFQSIVRRGGLAGLGTTLISQRPALVNKSVLTQLDVLVLLRVVAGNDQDYIDNNYVKRAGSPAEREALMSSLASLSLGEAWVWEPGAEPPLFERVQIRGRRTFNSSATPRPGETQIEPKMLAEVDLAAIKEAMAATVEKAKSDDPVELRARVRELERQLRDRPAAEPEPVEVSVLTDADRGLLLAVAEALNSQLQPFFESFRQLWAQLEPVVRKVEHSGLAVPPPTPAPARPAAPPRRRTAPPAAAGPPPPGPGTADPPPRDGPVKLKAGARRMVEVLGQVAPLRVTLGQWGALAKLRTTGGTWSSYYGQIRRAGLIDGNPDGFTLTDAGFEYLGGRPAPMDTGELQDHYRKVLKRGAAAMMDALIAAYPAALSNEQLAQASGNALTGGTFSNYRGVLVRNGLAESGEDGGLRASRVLVGDL